MFSLLLQGLPTFSRTGILMGNLPAWNCATYVPYALLLKVSMKREAVISLSSRTGEGYRRGLNMAFCIWVPM